MEITAIVGTFIFVLFVSFMFRVLGFLRRIAEGIDSLRAELRSRGGAPDTTGKQSPATTLMRDFR